MQKAVKRGEEPAAFINTLAKCGQYALFTLAQTRDKRPLSDQQRDTLRKARERVSCENCGELHHPGKLQPSPYGDQGQFCAWCITHILKERHERREECRQEARALLDQDIVILDTETTGLGSAAKIVELAIIDKAGNVLFNSLVNPGQAIPSEAVSIHGITDNMVKDAPTFADIVITVSGLLFGKVIGIYNASFDATLLVKHGAIFGSTVCLMNLYSRFYGEYSDFWESYKWQSLDAALFQCGLTRRGEAHRALSDCYAALDILNHVARKERPNRGDQMELRKP